MQMSKRNHPNQKKKLLFDLHGSLLSFNIYMAKYTFYYFFNTIHLSYFLYFTTVDGT